MKRKLYLLSPLFSFALAASAQDATTTTEQLAKEEQEVAISDGIFREYRLAVLFTKEEYESPRFNRDRNKIKAHLKELEDYLNSIYVRDAGVKFTMVYDDRLIDENLNSSDIYIDNAGTATNAITSRIGSDAYDVGISCNYNASNVSQGLEGLTSLGCIQWDQLKGNAFSCSQDNSTIAHELSHAFGCGHTFENGSEPGTIGMSIAGYGFSSSTHFLSLASLVQLINTAQKADRARNAAFTKTVSKTNTAPRIDRDRMKREYIVPRNTFFSIPVYATDDEQTQLNYAYAQWNYTAYKKAQFPTFPSQKNHVIDFGRRYSTANYTLVLNSNTLPVGDYKMLFSVSDALPTEEAIAKKQAPLRDNYLTMVKVVNVDKPFKINPTLKTEFKTGERITLKWDVDKTFFSEDSKVRVLLSDDGGQTFTHILVPETANDGECEVVMPQEVLDKLPTYMIGETAIYSIGKAVLRLEVIGKGYYDITDNNTCNGGSTISDCGIKFNNLPESNYIKIGKDEAMPTAPTLTATKNGANVNVAYSESQEGNLTRRLWVANDGTTESAYVQWVERDMHDAINVSFAYTDGAINGVDYICSFSAPYPTQLPEGITAYYISPSKSNAQKATMLEWNDRIIPANQGMLLVSESGDDAELCPTSTEVAALNDGTNLLKHSAGAAKTITTDDNAFILAYGDNGLAFCKAKIGSTLAANKAYLSLPTSAQSISLDFNSPTTSIAPIANNANEVDANAPFYDLSGRRVAQPTKGGVYIRNGKKIIF